MAIDRTEAALYGAGRGESFIWGDNRALAGLENLRRQDQLQRMKQDSEIQDQLSKINVDAARQEDMPQILEKYKGIKDTFVKMRGASSSDERMKLMAEMSQQKTELSRAVAVSKQFGAGLAELGKLRLTHADDLSDDFDSKYSPLTKMSAFDPKAAELVNDLTNNAVAPKFDHQGYASKLIARSLEQVQGSERVIHSNGLKRIVKEEGSRLNEDNLLNNAVVDYKNDRKFRRHIDSTYPNLSPEQALKTYSAELYVSSKDAYNKVEDKVVDKQWDQRSAPLTEWQKLQLKNGYKPGAAEQQAASTPETDRQAWVDNMFEGVPGSGERLKSIVSAQNGFTQDIGIDTRGGKLKFNIPDQQIVTLDGDGNEKIKIIPSRSVTIDKSNPNDKFKLNQLINDLTGEKISPSKFNTVPGKKGGLRTGGSNTSTSTKKTIKGF